MHHSVGGVVAIGAPLVNGGSVVDRRALFGPPLLGTTSRVGGARRFNISANSAAISSRRRRPPTSAHTLRLACGNGLSARGLARLRGRFRPTPRSSSSTPPPKAMSRSTTSRARSARSAGFRPFSRSRDPVALARFDDDAQAPQRSADGFCVRCANGEIGEALGRISDDRRRALRGLQ